MNWNPRTISFKPQTSRAFGEKVPGLVQAETAHTLNSKNSENKDILFFGQRNQDFSENEHFLPKELLCDDSDGDDNFDSVIGSLGTLSIDNTPFGKKAQTLERKDFRMTKKSVFKPGIDEWAKENKSQECLDLFKQKANSLSIKIGKPGRNSIARSEIFEQQISHQPCLPSFSPFEKNNANISFFHSNSTIPSLKSTECKESVFNYAVLAPVPRRASTFQTINFERSFLKTPTAKPISPFLDNGIQSYKPDFLEHREARIIKISNIPLGMVNDKIHNVCKQFGHVALIEFGISATRKYFYLGYFDIRHTVKAFQFFLTDTFLNCQVEYMEENVLPQLINFTEMFDPKILYHNKTRINIHYQTEKVTKTYLESFLTKMVGTVKLLAEISVIESYAQSFICEFYDCRLRNYVENKINGYQIMPNCFIQVEIDLSFTSKTKMQRPIMIPETTNHSENLKFDTPSLHDPNQLNKILAENKLRVSRLVMNESQMCLDNVLSMNDILKLGSLDFSLRPTETVFSRFNDQETEESGSFVVTKAAVPNSNKVNLRSIVKGLDTRVTMMLRNIPNKVDQQTLQEYIDVTNKGTYDFLYLRIDFLNKCNVGYAFISFTAPEHIITFAKARCGTKWTKFNSEKICDISYANI